MKYRYHWTAWYEDGTEFYQFGGLKEISVGSLDFSRVTRIRLSPQMEGYPIVDLKVDPNKGEKAIKYWQNDINAQSGELANHKEVLGIQKNVNGRAVKFFVHFNMDGSIHIGTSEDV